MSSVAKKSKAKGGHALDLSTAAFAGRTVVSGTIFDSVESTILDTGGNPTHSSYPHLTHASSGADARAAHITSSRVVAATATHVIHQRFHQNNDGVSVPTHDRYFAVDQANGEVSGVKASFSADKHIGKKDVLPMRGTSLADSSSAHSKMEFQVLGRDEKHPPLSPRSAKRILPDTGYKS